MADGGAEQEAALLRVVASVLDAAHQVPPHRLASLLIDASTALGATSTRIWLADHPQRSLVELTEGEPETPMSIESSAAGRSFTTCAEVELDRDRGGTHAWMPLTDGVNRLGVLEIEIDELTDALKDAYRHLASVAASELITRGQYTDLFTVTRRREPMTLTAELQWQGLPPTAFTADEVSVAGMLEPAYKAAGDSFDYAHAAGRLSFAVFDAVGHDLESSIVSTLAVGAYRNRRRSGADLDEMADTVDAVVRDQIGASCYATGQLAQLDTDSGVLRWVNAGHPLPLLIRDGRVIGEMACRPRLPFGLGHLARNPSHEVAEVHLEPGDAVFLYTDGIIEARRPGGADFGLDRLCNFLHQAFAAGLSPAETVRRLSNAVLDYHDRVLQDDATTLLTVWHPNGP